MAARDGPSSTSIVLAVSVLAKRSPSPDTEHPRSFHDVWRQAVRDPDGSDGVVGATPEEAALSVVVLLSHALCLVSLGLFAVHRAWLAVVVARRVAAPPTPTRDDTPVVTVQVPLYDEAAVAGRVIAAVGALDWPRDRLQIQVLDDSTDDTRDVVDAAVARLRRQGIDVEVRRRTARTGFKAGALAEGLATAKGSVVAVFDADFVPDAGFLRCTVPHLGEGVGVVQARWGHLNADADALASAQAVLLDAHFVLEHGGRAALGCWFNFNGTAGIWRREAIDDAGGWSHDTLTEDLDLSYRAQLAGWRFVYVDDVVVPAELPPTMAAFLAQQHRWARGGVQTARKLLGRIVAADAPWRVRAEAVAHFAGNAGYPLTLALTLLLPLAPWARVAAGLDVPLWVDLTVFAACVVPLLAAYAVAVRRAGVDVTGRLLRLPAVLALGIGMAAAQTRAVVAGLWGPVGTFERTPKQGDAVALPYAVRRRGRGGVEALLAAWQAVGLAIAAAVGDVGAVPFLVLFGAGNLWVARGLWTVSAPTPVASSRGAIVEADAA